MTKLILLRMEKLELENLYYWNLTLVATQYIFQKGTNFRALRAIAP